MINRIISIVSNAPNAVKTYPRFYKEFGIQMANVQFKEQLLSSYVGFSEYFIERASAFMKKELKPVVEQYKKNRTIPNYIEKSKKDFEGKWPVWVCWWQGEANMPPIVKVCYEKIRRVFETETTCVVLITEHNYNRYIVFPDHIIEKYNRGLIIKQHFADILRWGLVAKYGGGG